MASSTRRMSPLRIVRLIPIIVILIVLLAFPLWLPIVILIGQRAFVWIAYRVQYVVSWTDQMGAYQRAYNRDPGQQGTFSYHVPTEAQWWSTPVSTHFSQLVRGGGPVTIGTYAVIAIVPLVLLIGFVALFIKNLPDDPPAKPAQGKVAAAPVAPQVQAPAAPAAPQVQAPTEIRIVFEGGYAPAPQPEQQAPPRGGGGGGGEREKAPARRPAPEQSDSDGEAERPRSRVRPRAKPSPQQSQPEVMRTRQAPSRVSPRSSAPQQEKPTTAFLPIVAANPSPNAGEAERIRIPLPRWPRAKRPPPDS